MQYVIAIERASKMMRGVYLSGPFFARRAADAAAVAALGCDSTVSAQVWSVDTVAALRSAGWTATDHATWQALGQAERLLGAEEWREVAPCQ